MEVAISEPATPVPKAEEAITPQIIDSPEKIEVTPKKVDQGDTANATKAERLKLPRVKSDSDIEILSSDDDADATHNTSEDNYNDDAMPSSQDNDGPLPSSQEQDEDSEDSVDSEMDSESDGDIVKMDGTDYAKINSSDDELSEEDEDSEMVLSQESEKSVAKFVKMSPPKRAANKRTRTAVKSPRKDYRTVTWRLKARSMKILNKRMQIMDENNDTNNDQDKADLKVLQQQSPTQPDGDAQKIILAQLKEKFYQQQSAKLKSVEPVVKQTTTVALDDSDEVVESKSEKKLTGEKNGHDSDEIDIYAEEEEEDEDEDEFDELTPINGTASSEQPSNESLSHNEAKDVEPMQIDLSSEGDSTVVEPKTTPKPVAEADTAKKEHNNIDFEDLLDNAPQEKATPSTEQCDKTPKNAINPKQADTSTPKPTTPAPPAEESKENEITSSQNVVEKQPANVAESPKLCKLEDVESEAKTPPPLPPRSRKRQLSNEYEPAEEHLVPSKKLKAELDANFGAHDRLLREYILHSTNNSTHLDDIQAHAHQLTQEIQQLNELVRIKEMEWNNMVHLKKVKEEILLRLNRKINVMELMTTKVGDAEDTGTANPLITNLLSQPFQKHTNRDSLGSLNNSMIPLIASTPSNSALAAGAGYGQAAMEAAATSNASVFSTASSTAAILQGRANMKSSDLAKEKVNAAKVHRNILPKPTLPNHQQILNNLAMSAAQSSAAAAASGGPSSQEKAQTAAVAVLNAYHAQLSSLQSQVDLLNGHTGGGVGGGTMTQQQQQNFYNSQIQMGRQGVIKDVKSIIADYRQKHPENVPRRGRRLKGLLGQPADSKRLSELGILLSGMDGNSRPSSTESMHSNSNNTPFTTTTTTAAAANSNNNNGMTTMDSFKDVLAQFATLSQNERNLISSVAAALPGTNTSSSSAANFLASLNLPSTLTTTTASGKAAPPPAYPEVTLHPVGAASNSNFLSGVTDLKPNTSSNNSTVNNNNNNKNVSNNNLGATNSSLLHGILTKSQNRTNTSFTSSFSPTLARLLTAPERISPQNAFHQSTSALTPTSNPILGGNANSAMSAALAAASAGLNLSKMSQQNSEITITPVMSAAAAAAVAASNTSGLQMTLLQQQLQQQNRLKQEPFVNMDEDSADRLVIDESFNDPQQQTGHGQGVQEFHENEVPECQGCKKREAQFVCAGCGNQWYCSRECQVNAWDDHSDVCTG